MKLRFVVAIFLLLGSAPVCVCAATSYEAPAEQRTGVIRRIFVVSHSHLDIGFTKPPDEIARDYKVNIDHAIDIAGKNADFRWVIESTWQLEEWLRRTRDPEDIARLGRLFRSGKISLGAAFANMHSGLIGPEEMNRLLYPAQRFRAQFGIPIQVAFQNDVPGFSWAWPRVLSGSGVRYLVEGLNLFFGGGNDLGESSNPFYWVGPDGSRVLTWFAYDSYVEGYRWKVDPHFSLEEAEATVPRRLAWIETHGYRYDAMLLMAAPGDNEDAVGGLDLLRWIRRWNQKHPDIVLQMATPEEFFSYLTEKYGDHFPEARGDSAGHWELVKLGSPEASARLRGTSNLLPAAETFASIAAIVRGSEFPSFDFADAWRRLLTWHEHSAGNGAAWPHYWSLAATNWNNVANYADAMLAWSNSSQQFYRAASQIAATDRLSSPTPDQAGHTDVYPFLVMNGLGWKRTGPVVLDSLPDALDAGNLSVTDLVTGEELPCEDVPGTRRHAIFVAKQVPPFGYRAYRLHKSSDPIGHIAPPQLDLEWDEAGVLKSLVDRSGGAPLLEPALAGTLYVSRDRGALSPEPLPAPKISVDEGAVARTIRFARAGSAMPLLEVRLYRLDPWADIRVDIDMNAVRSTARTLLQYAFALPAAGPRTYVDGAGFILRVPEDYLPGGAAPHMVPVHFVHYGQTSTPGVTVANRDAFALGPDRVWMLAEDALTTETKSEGIRPLFLTEPHGAPVQSFSFRLAVQPADVAAWERFGEDFNLPLLAVPASDVRLPSEASWFSLSSDHVQLLAFKPAENRPGAYILRFQEIGGQPAHDVALSSLLNLSSATRTSLVESETTTSFDLSHFSIGPWETITVLVRPIPSRPRS